MRWTALFVSLSFFASTGCTTTPKPIQHAVAPRSPARDPGKSSTTRESPPDAHAAALEQLAIAPFEARTDRQKSVRILLPDMSSWRRVRFLGIKSLVGFRYGIDHHAVAGAFVMDVKDRTPATCQQAFERWAKPWLETFEVEYQFDKPVGFTWRNTLRPNDPPEILSAVTLSARTTSVLAHDSYHATYAIYPAWPDKCLVVGMATVARGEDERAKKARDRFAQEVFSKLELTSEAAPTKSY